MIDFDYKDKYTFDDLRKIMKLLRGEGGCPWDREQTHKSIRNDFLEETYEALEAIDNDSSEMLCEELGDVLLQVVFHSEISEEANDFNIDDVADGICKKLIVRHPHVFGDTSVSGADDVLANWDIIKYKTKKYNDLPAQLDGVAATFPALIKAAKYQKRAEKAGLLDEKHFELSLDSNIETEYARTLFKLVNKARNEKIDLEETLNKYIAQFRKQF